MAQVVTTTTLGNNLFTLINNKNRINFVHRRIKSTKKKKQKQIKIKTKQKTQNQTK